MSATLKRTTAMPMQHVATSMILFYATVHPAIQEMEQRAKVGLFETNTSILSLGDNAPLPMTCPSSTIAR